MPLKSFKYGGENKVHKGINLWTIIEYILNMWFFIRMKINGRME